MKITDPERAAKALIGLCIQGIEIGEDGSVFINLNGGTMEIDFVEGEIYIEVEEKQ
jgi:hypothetical protein